MENQVCPYVIAWCLKVGPAQIREKTLPEKIGFHEKTRKSRRSSSSLPPNWKKFRDEETQQVYYNNTVTDEVTWDLPLE